MKKIIVICGATASGKSDLALALAQTVGGEILCADSMQIYKGLDIGTAKPTATERASVPHHMTDIIEPWESYSVSRYEQEGGQAVEDILSRGKIPVVCGGTGLYINALIQGGGFAQSGIPHGLRAQLEAQWEEKGGHAMLEQLAVIDPPTAARLHPNDKKRIVRALEVWQATGMTLTQHHIKSREHPPRYQALMLAPNPRLRSQLYDRIDRRVDNMLEIGLCEEVEALWREGKLAGTAAQAIGYKELVDWLEGRISKAAAIDIIKQKTRNYAKRQLTWFGADLRIQWLLYDRYDLAQLFPDATKYLSEFGYDVGVI